MLETTRTKSYSITELLTGDEVLRNADTRALLLAQGIRLFHRYGVDGTSVGRIIKVTGKSKSQFYSHFSSREEFICHILELQMTTMIKVTARTPLERLEDFPLWFAPYEELGHLPGHLGCPTGPLATELSPSCEQVQEAAGKQFNRWENYMSDCLLGLFQSNSSAASAEEARLIGQQLCCSIQGAFLLGRVHQTGKYITQVGRQYYQVLRSLLHSELN